MFLDGSPVYELGRPTAAAPWFRLCRDQGFDPEAHLDLDPVLILFRQVVPALARDWHDSPLPFEASGLPAGVVCLATVQAAWERAVATQLDRLKGTGTGDLAASCLDGLPLRAVVFHDDPRRREDFVGTGVDDPLLGVFLHLGASRSRPVTLARATVVSTGGLRWSPWELGGDWVQDGREFRATLAPDDFLRAAGLGREAPRGFPAVFQAAVAAVLRDLEPALEAYRETWPTGVVWHRDPLARYLHHMIVDVRMTAEQAFLILDDGTEVAVAHLVGESVCVP